MSSATKMFVLFLSCQISPTVAQLSDSARAAIIKNRPSPNRTRRTTIQWIESLNASYDKFQTPSFGRKKPTSVTVGIYIENLGNFQATSMDFELDIYFKEWWQDHRLRHVGEEFPGMNDPEVIGKLWRPDLYFANSKEARSNRITVANTYMEVNASGHVFYSTRVSLKLMCSMDFQWYPLDHQNCSVRIISYGLTTDKMNCTWDGKGVNDFADEIAELQLLDTQTTYCNGSYPLGTFSCLEVKFYLKRKIGFYLVQHYIPTMCIVFVSWIAFWIDPDSVPGRVTLSVTTLLTIATQGAGILYRLPRVAYAKAIDIWMGACMAFVFMALIEYAIVNTFLNRTTYWPPSAKMTKMFESETNDDETKNGLLPSGPTSPVLQRSQPNNNNEQAVSAELLGRLSALRIDKMSRILFPALFIAFNCAYWYYYTG